MRRAFGYSLLFGIFASFAAIAGQYEPAVVFNATDVLGKQLTGSRYQVNAEVTNDGYFNHFVARLHGLDTRIVSNDWMVEQLYEEDAIGVLRQIKQSDAYKRAGCRTGSTFGADTKYPGRPGCNTGVDT